MDDLSKVLAKVDDGERRIRANITSQRTSRSPPRRKSPPRVYPHPIRQSTEPAGPVLRSVTPITASGRCYNCGKEGHYASDCPAPRKIKKEDIREIGVDREGSTSEVSDEEATIVEEDYSRSEN